MSIEQVVAALNSYDVRKRLLAPERYAGLDQFRDMVAEYFPPFVPGGPPPDFAGQARKLKALTALLAGSADNGELEKELGFTYAELQAALRASAPVLRPLPDRLVLMTFDDATLDHYQVACPILEEYGFHGNLFVTEMEQGMFNAPGFSDKSRYMTWEQIRELSDRGHEICNHSWHHNWDFPRLSREEKQAEIAGIEARCAQYGIPKPIVFGTPGGTVDPETEALAAEMGYRWGRGSRQGYTPLNMGDALYDPYVDTPLVAPANQAIFHLDDLKAALEQACGKVIIMVFHGIDDKRMPGPAFADCVRTISEMGGRCITFRELEEYIDPLKARAYVSGAYRAL